MSGRQLAVLLEECRRPVVGPKSIGRRLGPLLSRRGRVPTRRLNLRRPAAKPFGS